MFNPKVTIIVPVYNLENYIEKTIKSIQNQTYKNLEIIIVNDGSQDSSLSIVERLKASDGRIKCVTQINGGAAKARNKGLELATGEYITFVDGDDLLSPEIIEDNIKYFIDCNIDWVAFSVIKIYENGAFKLEGDTGFKIEKNEYIEKHQLVPYFYKHKLSGVACGAIYKYSSIQDIRFRDGMFYEDSMFFVDLICRTQQAYLSTDGIYYYVDRPNSSNKMVWDYKHLESKYEIVIKRLSEFRRLYPLFEDYYLKDEILNYYFFKREAAKGTEGASFFYSKLKKSIGPKIQLNILEELKCLGYRCGIHKIYKKIRCFFQ